MGRHAPKSSTLKFGKAGGSGALGDWAARAIGITSAKLWKGATTWPADVEESFRKTGEVPGNVGTAPCETTVGTFSEEVTASELALGTPPSSTPTKGI